MSPSIHTKVFNKARLWLHLVQFQTELRRSDLTHLLQHCLFGRKPFTSTSWKFARHRHANKVSDGNTTNRETDRKSRVCKADDESAHEERRECQRNGDPCPGCTPHRSAKHEPHEQSQSGAPEKSLINAGWRNQSRHDPIPLAQGVPSLSPLPHWEDSIKLGSRANGAWRHTGNLHGQISDLEEASNRRTSGRRTRKPRDYESGEIGNGPHFATFRVREGYIEVILHFHHNLNAVKAHPPIIDGSAARTWSESDGVPEYGIPQGYSEVLAINDNGDFVGYREDSSDRNIPCIWINAFLRRQEIAECEPDRNRNPTRDAQRTPEHEERATVRCPGQDVRG